MFSCSLNFKHFSLSNSWCHWTLPVSLDFGGEDLGWVFSQHSQAASGCLSISASLEIPLWLRLEPLWLHLEGVPVLTSHRCVSMQPPWSAISFSLLPVKNGCLPVEVAIMLILSNWARRQGDSLYCFTSSASAWSLLTPCRPTLSLPQAMAYWTWDKFFT